MSLPLHTREFYAPEETRKLVIQGAINGFHDKLNRLETGDYKFRVSELS